MPTSKIVEHTSGMIFLELVLVQLIKHAISSFFTNGCDSWLASPCSPESLSKDHTHFTLSSYFPPLACLFLVSFPLLYLQHLIGSFLNLFHHKQLFLQFRICFLQVGQFSLYLVLIVVKYLPQVFSLHPFHIFINKLIHIINHRCVFVLHLFISL